MFDLWNLDIGYYLVIGAWSLVIVSLFPSSLKNLLPALCFEETALNIF
jgi:hypothetical protein